MTTTTDRVTVQPIGAYDDGTIGYLVRGVDSIEEARRAAIDFADKQDNPERYPDPRNMRAQVGFWRWSMNAAMAEEPGDKFLDSAEPGTRGAFPACFFVVEGY